MKKFLVCGIALLLALTACEQAQDSGAAGQEPVFAITGGSDPLNRGDTRQFAVNPPYDVTWTVEGADPDGGTVINAASDELTVGGHETSGTFTVKAVSVENPQAFDTVTVAVGDPLAFWEELTDGLKGLITGIGNGGDMWSVGVYSISFGIKVLAYGEGVGAGKGRWIVGGGSDYHESYAPVAGYLYPVMAYSDDDGETWTEIHTTPALLYQEMPRSLIYDGPAGGKKFVLSTEKGSVFWSEDGTTWTRVPNVHPGFAPADAINHLDQVIYGDIDRADGGRGVYLVLGARGRFTWSNDGKTWERQYVIDDWKEDWKYIYRSPRAGTLPGCQGELVRYGTGFIDGKRVKMFFGTGIENVWDENYYLIARDPVNVYSLDGMNWVALAEAEVAAVAFEPVPPAGANRELSWLDEADTSALEYAVDETIYTYNGKSGPIIAGPGVSSRVDFVAYGNGKYLAVGLGRRLARTDAETARK
jgi:hypothetical protein